MITKKYVCSLIILFILSNSYCNEMIKDEFYLDNAHGVIYYKGDMYLKTQNLENNLNVFNLQESKRKLEEITHPTQTNSTECHETALSNGEIAGYAVGLVFIVVCAGIFSGLTVGYLSIDDLVLELKLETGTDDEKRKAKRVMSVLHNRHWLLCTLLVAGALMMEALPIILSKLVNELASIIISVFAVLLFGEILPQAFCTGPKQVSIASSLSPFTKCLMYFFSPISWPLGKLLDCIFGKHTKSRFLNSDLKVLIELHTFQALEKHELLEKDNDAKSDEAKSEGACEINDVVSLDNKKDRLRSMSMSNLDFGLDQEQANLMIGAIELKKRTASDIMIQHDKVYMLDIDSVLNKEKILDLVTHGHSRIPIYQENKNNILGILMTKHLVSTDFQNEVTFSTSNVKLKPCLVVSPDTFLLELLREFKIGRSHMALVTNNVKYYQQKLNLNQNNSLSLEKNYNKDDLKEGNELEIKDISIMVKRDEDIDKKVEPRILGIVTLEDVIENIIKMEILDEKDIDKKMGKHLAKHLKFKMSVKEAAIAFIKDEAGKIKNLLEENTIQKSKSGKLAKQKESGAALEAHKPTSKSKSFKNILNGPLVSDAGNIITESNK